MLPSNATVETPATTGLPRLKSWYQYAEHALAYRMSFEAYTAYASDNGILLLKYEKSKCLEMLLCISNNISPPGRLFCNNHENKYFISILSRQQNWSFSFNEERSRSICDVILTQNCRENCSLLHPFDFRNADNWFSF